MSYAEPAMPHSAMGMQPQVVRELTAPWENEQVYIERVTGHPTPGPAHRTPGPQARPGYPPAAQRPGRESGGPPRSGMVSQLAPPSLRHPMAAYGPGPGHACHTPRKSMPLAVLAANHRAFIHPAMPSR